jgi:hypothetical protein
VLLEAVQRELGVVIHVNFAGLRRETRTRERTSSTTA